MSLTRRQFVQASSAALAWSQVGESSPPQARRKVIYDQDNAGPLSTDTLGMLMLLQADNIDLLGITLVTGDQWLKQEMAYTLRLLEMMGRPEVPVFAGAEYPILNTKKEALLRYELYGGHRLNPWLGAFNRSNTGPDEVKPLPPPYGRFAQIKPQAEHAVKFIIQTVRQNPGQVTIYCGGPLTNLALAIRLAPDIIPLVPEVVFMGTGLNHFTSSYNVFFDPEAAKIVLREPWRKFTVVTVDIAEEIHLGDDLRPGRTMVDEIVDRAASPFAELFREHAQKPHRENPRMRWFRMPDEMIAAQIIEPSIFTRTEEMYVAIHTSPGPRYGDAMFWEKDWQAVWKTRGTTPQWAAGPPPSAGLVRVLTDLDRSRFKQLFVELMTKPVRKT